MLGRSEEVSLPYTPEGLDEAIRQATNFLLSHVEDPEEIWVLPPRRTRRRIGSEEVQRRYREVTVEVPVYEMLEQEVLVQRRGDSDRPGGTLQTRTLRVRGERTGTRTDVRLRRDDDGPIVRTERRAIWGDGGPDEWFLGTLGNNALVALALLRSDLPEAQEAAVPMIEFFSELVQEHGPPDLTWDLAWLIVLFAEYGDVSLHEMTSRMTGKLMLGQVRQGAAAGLWGPMAIDPEHLAALWQRYYDASFAYEGLVARFGESPRSRAEQQRLAEAVQQVQETRQAIQEYTWFYRLVRPQNTWLQLEDEFGDPAPYRFLQPPEYVINQQTADMESTWLALYAIRIARDRNLVPGQLPQAPARLPGNRRAVAPSPPPSPRDVLHLASQALGRAAHGSGAFSELNRHQPVRAFDEMTALPGVPLSHDVRFPELPSPNTLTATAQGFSALVQIGRIMGMGAVREQAPVMVRAKRLLDDRLDSVMEGDHSIVGGSGMGILNLYLALLDPGPEIAAAPRRLREEAVAHLIRLQNERDDGSLRPLADQDFLAATVWRHRISALPRIPRAWTQFDYTQPFTNFPPGENSDADRSRFFSRFGRVQPRLTTAVGLLILCEERMGIQMIPE